MPKPINSARLTFKPPVIGGKASRDGLFCGIARHFSTDDSSGGSGSRVGFGTISLRLQTRHGHVHNPCFSPRTAQRRKTSLSEPLFGDNGSSGGRLVAPYAVALRVSQHRAE